MFRTRLRVIAVDYVSDYVHHATMEPMNATALVSGDTVEIWAPTQGPTATQGFAASATGTTPDMFATDGGQDGVVTDGTIFNYRVPAHLVEFIRQDSGRDVGFWRAVGYGYNTFGVECVIDEVAAAKGVDPPAFRLELLAEVPPARKVIEAVAEMTEWSRKRDGRALGIAYSNAFGAHCAQIAEVSLDRESGEIRGHNVWRIVDPGVAIQPLNIDAQVAGAIVHGASHALYEQINIVDGEVQETNFDSYRVMRMSEMPEIHIRITPTPENKPAGIGEVGLRRPDRRSQTRWRGSPAAYGCGTIPFCPTA